MNQTAATVTSIAPPLLEALIVGAGFGGMGMAIQLKRMGIDDFLIVDQADDLGGTWHLNTYPGLAVDIPSMTYSYSFEPNPHWSHLYAPGHELKAYANHVAEKYGLRRHMQFHAEVEQVRFVEADDSWMVHFRHGETRRARLLILATGYLSHPKRPDIPGLDDFQGKVIHTAAWDHDYSLEGRQAAVIGTGATAVQLLPEIAPRLKHLTVFQRTPIWVAPKLNPAIPGSARRTFAARPGTQRTARLAGSGILELIMVAGALHNRELSFLTRGMEAVCKLHLRAQIPGAELRRRLTPDYSFGCKRPTFSNDYYPVFNRRNVTLVTEPIARIRPGSIETVKERRHPIDTLILATGFKVWEKGNFPAFPVHGAGGRELGDWWDANRYQAYEGITVPGFPNLFNLPSPYSFTGLSYFFTIEAQMKHVERCVGEMRRRRASRVEISPEANAAFLAEMQRNMGSTVFKHGHCAPANSYYFNPHGEASLLRPTTTATALWRAANFPLWHYRFGGTR